jgi:osmotically inducible lipoprotein OsmB
LDAQPRHESQIMNTMKYLVLAPILACGLLVASCGTTTGDRALSGGLLGAGAGAAIGSMSGNAGAGAVIGGVAGAAVGALTSPQDINLGTPAWRRSHYCVRRDDNGRCTQTASR